MAIDKQKLNAAHNQLKEIVGENGAFILLLAKMEPSDEDVQIRLKGSDTRLAGLLESCSAYLKEHFRKKFADHVKPMPSEPD